MLKIETDGTVTSGGYRIGEVKLDNERDRFKIGNILRECSSDKIDELKLSLDETQRELDVLEQQAGCGGDCEASDTIKKIRELVA